jgi:hypothetical protein
MPEQFVSILSKTAQDRQSILWVIQLALRFDF